MSAATTCRSSTSAAGTWPRRSRSTRVRACGSPRTSSRPASRCRRIGIPARCSATRRRVRGSTASTTTSTAPAHFSMSRPGRCTRSSASRTTRARGSTCTASTSTCARTAVSSRSPTGPAPSRRTTRCARRRATAGRTCSSADLAADLSDPDTYLGGPPHELFAELRRTDPVHWQPTASGGYWAVLTHAGVEQVARDPVTFSSAAGGVVLEDLDPDRLEQMRGMLLAMDPPRHREVRRPLVARLTPKRIAVLDGDIRAICQDVFASADGDVDFVGEVAARLPTRVIGQVMGLPRDDWDRVHALAERTTRAKAPAYAEGPESAGQASREMGLYAYEFAHSRLALDRQPDDLTTVLLADRDPAAFASLFVQLVTAGQDTTATLIAGGLLALLQHPDQLDALRADPALVPSAVEEMLRYANPLHYFRRTVTTGTELHGVPIAAGDKVAMYYTSANRDEDVFSNPQTFDVTRSPNKHLSFGIAEHFCIGAHLARLEARSFFEELFATYASVEPAGEPVRLRSNLNNALRSLPVRLVRPRVGRPS